PGQAAPEVHPAPPAHPEGTRARGRRRRAAHRRRVGLLPRGGAQAPRLEVVPKPGVLEQVLASGLGDDARLVVRRQPALLPGLVQPAPGAARLLGELLVPRLRAPALDDLVLELAVGAPPGGLDLDR